MKKISPPLRRGSDVSNIHAVIHGFLHDDFLIHDVDDSVGKVLVINYNCL